MSKWHLRQLFVYLIDLNKLVLYGHKYDDVVENGAFRSAEGFGILRRHGQFAQNRDLRQLHVAVMPAESC